MAAKHKIIFVFVAWPVYVVSADRTIVVVVGAAYVYWSRFRFEFCVFLSLRAKRLPFPSVEDRAE